MEGAITIFPHDSVGEEEEEELEPACGSWVAELEQTKRVLEDALRSEDGIGEALLEMHLRLCRAHSRLRRWVRLYEASNKPLWNRGARNRA